MKKAVCVALCICILLVCTGCISKKKYDTISDYPELLKTVTDADLHMPTTEQLGNYSQIELSHKRYEILFRTDTAAAFLTYTQEAYLAQKAYIEDHYVFYHPDDPDLVSDCEEDYNGYHFCLVRTSYSLPTCKMGLLIGTDDAAQRICYLYYYDFDLDRLHDLNHFLDEYAYFPS